MNIVAHIYECPHCRERITITMDALRSQRRILHICKDRDGNPITGSAAAS